MKEVQSRFDRPQTRREMLREALGYGLLLGGAGTNLGAILSSEDPSSNPYYDKHPELRPEKRNYTNADVAKIVGLLAIGTGAMVKGAEMMLSEEEASFGTFVSYLQTEGVQEVTVEPIVEAVTSYMPSVGTGFAGGGGTHHYQGEGFFTRFSAQNREGKEVTFTQRNDLLVKGEESHVYPIARMKNAMTVEDRADLLREHLPDITVRIGGGEEMGELVLEGKRRGLTVYPMLKKEAS